MKLNTKIIVAAMMLVPALYACEREGPLERAGEEVDEAIKDVRNGGETTGNKVDDAVDDIRDGVKDARKELN
jgi:predicted small lipoprotein YifL